jgi:hypothetical protein
MNEGLDSGVGPLSGRLSIASLFRLQLVERLLRVEAEFGPVIQNKISQRKTIGAAGGDQRLEGSNFFAKEIASGAFLGARGAHGASEGPQGIGNAAAGCKDCVTRGISRQHAVTFIGLDLLPAGACAVQR